MFCFGDFEINAHSCKQAKAPLATPRSAIGAPRDRHPLLKAADSRLACVSCYYGIVATHARSGKYQLQIMPTRRPIFINLRASPQPYNCRPASRILQHAIFFRGLGLVTHFTIEYGQLQMHICVIPVRIILFLMPSPHVHFAFVTPTHYY